MSQTDDTKTASLSDLLAPGARQTEADLESWLVEPGVPERLAEAMRYCALGGGKRLRPALVRMAAESVGGDPADELTRRAAVAVELVHTYSLVHDDLPTMDDDTLRRGRPTAHVTFGEAMAILAGDALLTRAFGVLAGSDNPLAARLGGELAAAAGPAGMIAGQVADMDLCRLPDGVEALRYIHLHKTAALIRGATRMGAISGGADEGALAALNDYGEALGLAFQMVDDLLDVVGDANRLGKTPGKDAAAGKRTYVAEAGPDEARRLAEQKTTEAIRALSPLGDAAAGCRRLAELLAERTH